MTIIAAARVNGETAMAADSATTSRVQGDQFWCNEKKIIKRDGFLLGLTGDHNLTQQVQYGWEPPVESRDDPEMFMHHHFIPSLKTPLVERKDKEDQSSAELDARRVVQRAAELAIKYTDSCAGPIQVETL